MLTLQLTSLVLLFAGHFFPSAVAVAVSDAPSLDSRASSSTAPGYGTVRIQRSGYVVRATISNGPINIYDYKLATDLYNFLQSMNGSDAKVVVVDSANPNYFIGHYDLHGISLSSPPQGAGFNKSQELGDLAFKTVLTTVNMPQIVISEVNGRARGFGNEFTIQSDMRFAGPNAMFSQFEPSSGVIPGAGGLAYLVKLIGRARSMEYIIGAKDVDGKTAEAIGWANTAYSTVSELKYEVEALAQRIAKFPSTAIVAAKQSINIASVPNMDDMLADHQVFLKLAFSEPAQGLVSKFLVHSANQTAVPFEHDLAKGVMQLYK